MKISKLKFIDASKELYRPSMWKKQKENDFQRQNI